MSKIKVQVYTKEVVGFFKKLEKDILEKLPEEALKEIKKNTPYDTGALQEGYHIEEGYGEKAIVSDEDYWQHVEFGTSTQGAQPHIGPVLNDKRFIDGVVMESVKGVKGGMNTNG